MEGQLVRVWSPELPRGRVTALVAGVSPDSLLLARPLRGDSPLATSSPPVPPAVSLGSITRLDVQAPRTRREEILAEARFGALAGLLVGALTGYLFYEVGAEPSSIAGLAAGTVAGGAATAALVAAVRPGTGIGWRTIPVR